VQPQKITKITVPLIRERKAYPNSARITALTAYDFTFARLFDQAGIDILLVGDSVATVVQGEETTLPVTLEQIIYHARCVKRGAERALIVADLPFLSYQASPEQAILSAGQILKESGVSAVKLEGGVAMAQTVRRMVEVDIPVMGHIGLTPQSYHRMGGHKVQGRGNQNGSSTAREKIIKDAEALDKAGVFALVLEGVPGELAAEITRMVSIPTIGIGAGSDCDGQILVSHDLLGLNESFSPKFVKRFAGLASECKRAVGEYISEVQSGEFPAKEHTFSEVPPTARVVSSGDLKLV